MRLTNSETICLIGEFGESWYLREQVLEMIHQENLATTLNPVPDFSTTVAEGAILYGAHMDPDTEPIMLK